MTQVIGREPKEGPPQEHQEETEGISDRELALARGLVVAIGVAYLTVQLLLVPRGWPAGWDESVYLSQVTPGRQGLFFNPWHARGITLLVAPMTWLGGSVSDLRLYLMVLSAIAVTLTFWLWARLVGLAAVLAAFIFSFSWQGLLLASEVKPNYWAGILGLATAGLLARRLEGGRTRHVVLASVLLAATALVRPTEALVLAVALGAYVLLFRRRSWRDLVPLGIGLVLGWLPWVIEMSVRFGGLTGAMREAGKGQHFQVVPVTENILRHLAYTDRKGAHSLVPGEIWWGVLVVMAAVAIVRGVTRSERTAALLCSLGALALAAEYFIFVPAWAPRFLLPAYAVASVPLAIGIVSLLRRKGAVRVIGAVVLVLLIPWTIWQGSVTTQRAPTVTRGAFTLRVGMTIRRLADGHPCFVVSQRVYPQIAFTAGCSGARGQHRVPSTEKLKELSSGGRRVFVIRLKEAPDRSILASVTPVVFSTPRKTWYLYQVPRLTG